MAAFRTKENNSWLFLEFIGAIIFIWLPHLFDSILITQFLASRNQAHQSATQKREMFMLERVNVTQSALQLFNIARLQTYGYHSWVDGELMSHDMLDSMANRGLTTNKKGILQAIGMYEFIEKQSESARSRRFKKRKHTSINQTSDVESGSESSQ